MAQCKECGEVFSVTEVKDGICKYCKTGTSKPIIALKSVPENYLTDEEKARIIEEETLRAKIRNQNDPIVQEINGFRKTFGILFLVIGVPLIILIIKTS